MSLKEKSSHGQIYVRNAVLDKEVSSLGLFGVNM